MLVVTASISQAVLPNPYISIPQGVHELVSRLRQNSTLQKLDLESKVCLFQHFTV